MSLRILLVEDSEDDAELVMRFARQNREKPDFHRVDSESLMRDALQKGPWDLVLSDYSLPSFSGLKAIQVLRDTGARIPLIIVSGTIGEDTAVGAIKAGATDYVLKSDLGRLPIAIDRAIQEARDRIQEEQRLQEAQQQLLQSQKMETVGRLAGGVAHDVNNVLAAITLFAELAIDQVKANQLDPAVESLEAILKSKETAAGIVRQLLLFSRHKIGPAQIIDLVSVISGVESLIKRLIGEGIQLKLTKPTEPILVQGDRAQVEQIVLNLAVNARDAMSEGGVLTATLESQKLDKTPPDARMPIKPWAYAVLTVTDTGCGMPESVIQKIFEPFFTTKEPGKGTGLGLSVVYGILAQVGGTITVNSKPNQGTTITIYWPLATGQTQTSVDLSTKIEEFNRAKEGPITILLVEDEGYLREVMARTLKKQGHTVLVAEGAREALKILEEKKAIIGLLITDVIMPEMSGTELAKEANRVAPTLKILFLSGYADQSLQDFQINTNFMWFQEKPFSSKALIEKVNEIIRSE